MTFKRPPREDYIRVSVEIDGFCYEPAIEFRDGDCFMTMVGWLRMMAIAIRRERPAPPDESMARARALADRIASLYPDRAYFVEVWQDGLDGFAQVFQPFGVPRNLPPRGAL